MPIEKALADSKLLTATGRRRRDGRKPHQLDEVSRQDRSEELGVGLATIDRADAIMDYAPEAADACLARAISADAALKIARRASKAKTETARAAIVERGVAAAKKPKRPSSKRSTTPKSHKATSDVKWLLDYLKAWTEVLKKDALVALHQGKFSPEAAAFFARRLRAAFEPIAKEFEEWASMNGTK